MPPGPTKAWWEPTDLHSRFAEGGGGPRAQAPDGAMYSVAVNRFFFPDCVECLDGWNQWVRAVQELRPLGRAGSAWLEAIRPDQVRHGCTARWALRSFRCLGYAVMATDLVMV
jgi:hypothetical protein